jgi:hypothetical protein
MSIAWRKPIKVTLGDLVVAFACRLCIGRDGLDREKLQAHPTTGLEFMIHMEKVH